MQTESALNVKGYTEENQDDEIDISVALNNFIISLRTFGWIVALLLVVGIVVGFVVGSIVYVPEYTTSATFTIASRENGDNYYGFNKSIDDQLVTAETYVIQSTTLKNMVVEKLGENYSNCEITAQALSDTNLVTVNVTADSKAKAYVAIEEVISAFPQVSRKIYGDINVSLLDEVDVDEQAVNSFDKKMYTLLGGAGGLLIGLVIILIYSLNLNLVSDTETLQKYVNSDCIGKIPKVDFKHKKQESFVTIDNRNISDDFKESFQFLRTRTERFCRSKNCKTLLVTSTFPGEGKTTVAANLAMSLAQDGKKVLVIDGDLRNPSVLGRFPVAKKSKGFDDLLKGNCELSDALVSVPRTEIKLLSCNNSMQNASELLGSGRMANIISVAKSIADFVIIDSPPTDVMGDSITLSQYADASIFVVRQNYGKINNVIYSIESMKQTNTEFMGFILNSSYDKISLLDYGSYRKYNKYGYGYGNGYGKYKSNDGAKKNEQ